MIYLSYGGGVGSTALLLAKLSQIENGSIEPVFINHGVAQSGRVLALQARGRGFECKGYRDKESEIVRVLDVYCGAGGAAVGLAAAGFNLHGIDINVQPEYPFPYHCENAIKLSVEYIKNFDLIWASPPCQAYTKAAHRWRQEGRNYPDLVGKTRELLTAAGVPFVIENTQSAPIRHDLMLCGTMFNLNVLRHRFFEIEGFKVPQPIHEKHKGTVKNGDFTTVAGHGGNDNMHNYCKLNKMVGASKLQVWQHAMGIDWVTDMKSLAQCVPPAYSEYIGKSFISYIKSATPV